MNSGWQQMLRVVPMGLAVLTFVLVIVNSTLVLFNQSIQADIAQRQQFINQSAALGRVNQALIQSLANLAAANKDEQLAGLLSAQGIRYTVTPNAAAAAPAAGTAPPATTAAPATPAAAAAPAAGRRGN